MSTQKHAPASQNEKVGHNLITDFPVCVSENARVLRLHKSLSCEFFTDSSPD